MKLISYYSGVIAEEHAGRLSGVVGYPEEVKVRLHAAAPALLSEVDPEIRLFGTFGEV